MSAEHRSSRGGRPLHRKKDDERRISLGLQVTAKMRRHLEEIAYRDDTTLARAVEIMLERTANLDAWLAALNTADVGSLGDDRLEQLLKDAGWNNPAPNVWLRPVALSAVGIATAPAHIGAPTLTENSSPKKKGRKS